MQVKKSILTTISLILLVAASHAQVQEETRRLLVFFEVLPGAELTDRETVLMYETLLIDLSDSSDRIAVKEYGGQYLPVSDEEKNKAAEESAADSWIHVGISGNADLILVQIRSLDLLTGRIIIEDTIEKEMRRGIRDLQRQFWAEVSTPLADYFSSAISKDMNRGTLVFEGLPGTRVRGSSWKQTRIDADGEISFQVPLPATIPYRATKPGFFPVEGQVYMDQTEKVVSLEQSRGARIALDLYLHNMSYPGVDLIYFFVPDTVFGRIGLLTYLVGLSLNDSDNDMESIFVSHTLSNFSLSFGFFFSDPDRYFRPYFSLGAAWRIMTTSSYWGLEPTAPFAVQPIIGCEYARGQKYKVFAEYAPYFYWAPDRFLFALSLPLDRNPGFLFFPISEDWVDWAFAWEIFVFNVGVRIRL